MRFSLPRRRRPKHRRATAPFHWVATLFGATTALALALAPLAAPPASAASANPFAGLAGFTIVTEGDVVTGPAAAHVEGSMAVGGTLTVQNAWHFNAVHGGAALPTIDGRATQLLTGGAIDLDGTGEAVQLTQGALRVGDTSGSTVTQDGVTAGTGDYYHPVGDFSRKVRMAGQSSLDQVAAPGVWDSAFGGLFTDLRSASADIAALQPGAGVAAVIVEEPSNTNGVSANEKGLRLTAGVPNLWRVSAAQLSAIPTIKFLGGTTPSASTPLYVDVTDAGVVSITMPTFTGSPTQYAAAILYNFAHATDVALSGRNSPGVDGSVLAPNAALTLVSGYLEGQIAARSFTVLSNGEIHHIGFTPELPPVTPPPPDAVAPHVATTTATCEPSTVNSLTASAVTGVRYEWVSGGTGTVSQVALRGDELVPGTVYTLRAVAETGYTLSGTTEWSYTFVARPTDCGVVEPAPATGGFSFAERCGPDSSYTLAPAEHATYLVTVDGAAPVVMTAGTHPAIDGSSVSITVVADAGHELDPTVVASGGYRFGSAEYCDELVTHPLVHGDVTSTTATCEPGTADSYTVVAAAGVRYTRTVDGVTAAIEPGTYTSPRRGVDYRIDAWAESPAYGLDPDARSTWTLRFTGAADCGTTVPPTTPPVQQLATLAFTGGAAQAGLLGAGAALAAGLLLVAGTAAIERTRRLRLIRRMEG
jgi:choice-of-anchor A domain-containing protein